MPDPADALLAKYAGGAPDSTDALLSKYASDPADQLLEKYGAKAEPWWGTALRTVGTPIVRFGVEPVLGTMRELSERISHGVGSAISPAGLESPVEAGLRGLIQKTGPTTAEAYRQYGFTESPIPPWAEAVEAPGPYGTTVPVGRIARAATTPEAAGLATEMAAAEVLNPLAAVSVVPAARLAGRALGPLRGAPGLSSLGNFFSKGFSIVNPADREAVREIFRATRGVGAKVEDYVETRLDAAERLIRTAAKRKGEDASTTERFVRDLVETRHRDPALAARALPEETLAANVLEELGNELPNFRVREGLRPAELTRPAVGQPPDFEATLSELRTLIRSASRESGRPLEETLRSVQDLARGKAVPTARRVTQSEAAAADLMREFADQVGDFKEAALAAHNAVRYTPRIAEDALNKVLGTGGGRRIQVSELAPKLPGARATPAELTTSELEAAIESGSIRGTPVKRPLKPMLEAFGIRGRGTARSAANARAINEIADQFGVDETAAKAGWRSLGELGILREYQPAAKAALSRSYVHPDIFRFMDEFSHATTPPNLPAMNQFLRVWKPVVTTINPGFISRNFQWNGIVGWIFGNRNPRNWLDAAETMALASPTQVLKGLGKTTQAQMREEMLVNRVIRSGYSRELAPGLTEHRIVRPGAKRVLAAVERPAVIGRDVNAAGEDLARASFYIAMRRQGLTPAEAAKRVAQVYFDYSRDAFTRGENWLRSNLIPFYSWTRRILPLTFRALGEKPAAFAQLGAIEAFSARQAGLKPEDVRKLSPEFKSQGGIVVPPYPGGKGEGYTAIPMSAIGFFDPARMGQALGEGGRPLVEQWINSMAPPVKAIYEAIQARSTFTGREYKGRPVRLPAWVGAIPAANKDLGDLLGIFKGPDGYYGPDYLYTVFSTPGPFATMAGDLVLANQGNRKAGARALRWITGIRVSEGLMPERTVRFEKAAKARTSREAAREKAINLGKRRQLERKAREGVQ